MVAAPPSPGEDPFDTVTINPDGPSAQVIDLSSLGPQGQLSDALKTFAVSSAQIGQLFGVAIDNARQAASARAWSAVRAVSRVPETMSCSTSCSLESRM
jgi:hypothetical protein